MLAPNANCSISVNFTPASVGTLSATLQVSDNAPGSPQTLSLSGTGLAPAPAVTLIPGSLDFGTVTQGTSTPMNVTVTNGGTAALHITNVAIGGANMGDFGFSDPTCGNAVPINASCIITVTFKPLAAGFRTASVALTDDAPGSPQVINVMGNATAAPSSAVAVNPSSPDFGTATQGTSTPMNVTVNNTGTAALHISSVALGGANANEFSFSDPTCNSAIPVSGSCTIALAFMPSSVGAHAATLTLTDDAPDSPQVLTIKGMANPAVPGQPGVPGVDIPYLDPDHHRVPGRAGRVPGDLEQARAGEEHHPGIVWRAELPVDGQAQYVAVEAAAAVQVTGPQQDPPAQNFHATISASR